MVRETELREVPVVERNYSGGMYHGISLKSASVINAKYLSAIVSYANELTDALVFNPSALRRSFDSFVRSFRTAEDTARHEVKQSITL